MPVNWHGMRLDGGRETHENRLVFASSHCPQRRRTMTASVPDIQPDQVADILKGISIPSPPQILADLQMELLLPEPDMGAMAAMIAKDVGLAGSVLKTVNSSFFGLARKVSSIAHAVSLLGINSILNLVNAYYLRNETMNQGLSDADLAAMTRFWDSAMDVANCATLVCRQIHFPHRDQAYLLGLFHNAGIPLLKQKFLDYPAVQIAAYQHPEGRITQVENERLNTSHQVMGYYVAKTWKLPEEVCTAIRAHHNLERLPAGDDHHDLRQLACVLKLAEHIVGLHRVRGDQEADHEWERIGAEVMAELDLNRSDIEDIVSLAEEHGIGRQSYYL
jgi:HD-like signal output (HDOD) protein